MKDTSTAGGMSSSPEGGRPIGCPSWCTEHLDAGPQRPGFAETWHATTVGVVMLQNPTGESEPRPVSVELQTLVTDDLLEDTRERGETVATVMLREPLKELLLLHSAAECRQLAAWLMQAADDLDEVLDCRLVPPCPSWCQRAQTGHPFDEVEPGTGRYMRYHQCTLPAGVSISQDESCAVGGRNVVADAPRVWVGHDAMDPLPVDAAASVSAALAAAVETVRAADAA